jgi:hypothetical protein
MARIGRRIVLSSVGKLLTGRHKRALLASLLFAGLSTFLQSPSEAAKLSSFLTPKDLARPLLLDQNGLQLQLPTANHSRLAIPPSSTPTYLAIPLYGGEHVPTGISTIFTGQGGATVGPLDFNASVVSQVNTALAASGLVAIDTPQQNYIVEYLPRLSRSIPSASGSTAIAQSSSPQGGTPASSTTTNSASNELSQFLGGTLSYSQLAKNTVNDVETLLHFKSSKPTARKPSLNLEAQVVDPPLPAAIPEPSSWLIFGLAAGALALHRHFRARNRSSSSSGPAINRHP